MRRCSKCQAEYADGSQICRACGGILDEVFELPETQTFAPAAEGLGVRAAAYEEPATEPWPQEEYPPIVPPASAGDWICTKCGERVPATFDVCWNCDAESERANEEVASSTPPTSAPPPYPKRQCAACGSDRIVLGAEIADTGEGAAGTLAVIVDANPTALIFKNRLRGDLLADVCGACGHVELRVQNHHELYAHYEQSREKPR